MEVLGPTGARATPREVVEALRLRRPVGDRPRVVAAMIASVDGRATVDGRSVALGHPEDRGLLRELRTGADAVLAGPATLRAERYANLLDADQVEHRAAAGLRPHPVLATVSRRGTLRAADVAALRRARRADRASTPSAARASATRRPTSTSTRWATAASRCGACWRRCTATTASTASPARAGPRLLRAARRGGLPGRPAAHGRAAARRRATGRRRWRAPRSRPPAAPAPARRAPRRRPPVPALRGRTGERAAARSAGARCRLRPGPPAAHGHRQRQPGLVLRRGAAGRPRRAGRARARARRRRRGHHRRRRRVAA